MYYVFDDCFRPNYEARNIRLNSVTGWCGKQEAFTYVSVDLGQVFRVKVRHDFNKFVISYKIK